MVEFNLSYCFKLDDLIDAIKLLALLVLYYFSLEGVNTNIPLLQKLLYEESLEMKLVVNFFSCKCFLCLSYFTILLKIELTISAGLGSLWLHESLIIF